MAKNAYIGVDGVARKVKKMYVGVGGEQCTQIEYIESSGTQCIDTGFTPNQDTRLVMDAQLLSTSKDAFLFGSIIELYSRAFGLMYDSANDKFTSMYAGSGYDFAFDSMTDRFLIDMNKNTVSINDQSGSHPSGAVFTSECTLALFANDISEAQGLFATMKLYSCQIYDNGTLVRDFVPCVTASGVVGLFDKVNKAFYKNAGTGTFTAGASVGANLGMCKGIARKVKKGYIGDENGIARLFYSSGFQMVTGNIAWTDDALTVSIGAKPKYLLLWGYKTRTNYNYQYTAMYLDGEYHMTYNNGVPDAAKYTSSMGSWLTLSSTGFTVNISSLTSYDISGKIYYVALY